MESYVRKKLNSLEKVINASDDAGIFAQVELGKEVRDQITGDIFVATIDLDIAGEVHYVEAEQSDLYAAIDEMKDEIVRVVKSHQEKKRDTSRRESLKIKEKLRDPLQENNE